MSKDEILFDRRVVEAHLRQGAITNAELNNFLKSLPDRAKEAQWASIENLASRAYLRGIRGADPSPPDAPGPDKK
jgi:hypothetical protein